MFGPPRYSRPVALGEPLTGGTALFVYLGGAAFLLSLFGKKKKKKPTDEEANKRVIDAVGRLRGGLTGKWKRNRNGRTNITTFKVLDPATIQLPGGTLATNVGGRWYIDSLKGGLENPEFTPSWWRSHQDADTMDRVRSISYERCRWSGDTKERCSGLISEQSMEYCVFVENVNATLEQLDKACAGKLPNDLYIAQDTETYGR